MKPTRRRRWKRRIAVAAGLAVVGIAAVLFVIFCTNGPPQATPRVTGEEGAAPPARPSINVMTLNIAHGRSDGANQLLRSRSAIESNLGKIAAVLARERADVVALQEADGPSFWSGSFNHVQHLAEGASYTHRARGEHVKGLNLSYGTALLSMLPLSDALSVTFDPSPPTFSKGFVVCAFAWPGRPGLTIDVVSVHLDFMRASVRRKQVGQMADSLSARGRPIILMGDLNCGWIKEKSALRDLAKRLDLKAYRPTASDMGTFSSRKKRLDWILLSPELEFAGCKVLPDVLSDHLAVVAEIAIAKDKK